MDATLVLDHQTLPTRTSPDGSAAGTIVRALLSVSGTAPASESRVPLAIALVLDRSGSMSGARLDASRSAAAHAVERLHPNDVVSAVTFDDAVETLAEPARCRDQHGLVERLRRLESGGSTNLSGGWLRGRDHMQSAKRILDAAAGASYRIVLLTDGHANAGVTDRETLVNLAATARAHGITTTTIGVGDGYDDDLLRAMADAGGGNSWYVERPDQAQDVFAEELGNLLNVAAQGLTVTLALHPDLTMLAVHSDWPTTVVNDVFTFDMGDLYASEPKPLLFEIFVPAHVAAPHVLGTNIAVATLHVRGYVMNDEGGVELRTLSIPVAATLDGQQQTVPEVERAILMARSANARQDAAREQRAGNGAAAAEIMRAARHEIQSSSLHDLAVYSPELCAESDDVARLQEQYEHGHFSEQDAKYQMQRSHNEKRGKRSYDARLRREPPAP